MTYQEEFIKRDTETIGRMLAPYKDIHVLNSHGNLGDELIFAGCRALLGKIGIEYKEMLIDDENITGALALISGGGAWCRTWGDFMSHFLPLVEARFEKVIVLPSSFQMTEKIYNTISASKKTTFCAREEISYNLIGKHCDAILLHDLAFHFDFSPYINIKGNGNGVGDMVLNSFRMDEESMKVSFPNIEIPLNNEDTSVAKVTIEEWLRHLSEYDIIRTDRAHVMIAGAMIGKMVMYKPSNYHKVPAIANYSLKGLPVYPC